MRSRRGSVHGNALARLAALEAQVDARRAVPIVVNYGPGRVEGCGRSWPTEEAMLAELEGKQARPPLIIRLAVDPAVVAPEDAAK